MMKTLRIVVDVDGTLLNTDDAMVKYYNHTFSNHPDFVPADGLLIKYYDCRIQMPLISLRGLLSIFNTDFFWRTVTIKKDAMKYLKMLNDDERFQVVIWSYGSNDNLEKKRAYLKDNFGFVKDIILSNGTVVSKSEIATGGVIIDDHQKNLKNDKAYNILFMDRGIRNYNKDFVGKRTCSWEDTYRAIIEYYMYEFGE